MSKDDQERDKVLRRMLNTPPKPKKSTPKKAPSREASGASAKKAKKP